jgi:hypothetical protein
MKLRSEMLDFLDECRDTRHSPVDDATQEKIQEAIDSIGDGRDDVELSPGKKQALELSGSMTDDITFEPEDELSPGQRAAQGL